MAETPGSGAVFWTQAIQHLRRAQHCDLTRGQADAAERKALAAVAITNPRAQDYLAWRRSLAYVALGFAVIALVVALVDMIGTMSEWSELPFLTDAAVFLLLVRFASKLALGIGLLLAVRHWTDARRSRRAMTAGWAIAVAVPLVIILLPLADLMVDWDRLRSAEGDAIAQVRRAIAETLLAVAMFWSAVPSLLALFPGLLRAALTVKTLVPARGTGPVVAACVAPIYAVFFVVVFGQLQQFSGSVLMGLGILLVAGAPLVLLRRCRRLMPPLEDQEAARRVAQARGVVRWISAVGLVCVLVTLFRTKVLGMPLLGFDSDESMVSLWSFLDILAWFVAMLTTYTVVASDGILHAMRAADDNVEAWATDAGRRRDAEVLGAVTDALRAPAAVSATPS